MFVAHDLEDGYISRYRPATEKTEPFITSLRKPKGICLTGNGDLYIAESATGAIIRFAQGQREKVAMSTARVSYCAVLTTACG